MRLSSILALSLRMAARDLRAGELGVLIAALAIAVAGVTTVSLFGDRVQRALKHEANALLGADLVVSSGRELGPELLQEAKRLGLASAPTVRFPSMALAGEEGALTDVRAVPESYPLRGEIRIADQAFTRGSAAAAIPTRGSVWVDDKLSARLKLNVGDTITLGESEFRVDALIMHQPGVGIGFLSLAPSLIMNREDLAQTGLMQTGSRARFSLLIAGPPQAIETFRAFVEARADPGIRVEGVRDARPEIKAALERAERFLGLAALASVLLAAAAVALAARRYLQRHLDACAMMRCLGASQRLILTLFLCQFVVLGLGASVLGCLIGAVAQEGLASLLAPLARIELPPPGIAPALRGIAAGFALLLGFAFPPLMTLKRVPTLRVLRRDLKPPDSLSAVGYVLGAGLIVAMILWQANELRLGLYVLGGTVGAILVSVIAGYALLGAAAWAAKRVGGSLRIGLANLRRRRLGSLVQIAALSLGLMALLLLTLVRGDLLRSWQASIPPDAPNRFVVNIQPDQLAPLAVFFAQRKMPEPAIFPMVRGRLIAINDKPVSSDDYVDDRAKRLIDREFNLSWATRLQPDNTIVAGRFWTDGREPQLSVEDGIAQTLGIRLGDRLSYDVAGTRIEAPVTSLRRVEWDSFRVNFFVIAAPGVLDNFPVSYVTSFHLPSGEIGFLTDLARAFPNVLIIDVAAILAQVQTITTQVSRAVEFVFLFTLAAGLLVLYAAIAATRDERAREAAIMRTLGASRRQLSLMQLTEFAALGALCGAVAALCATICGWALAERVLHVSYSPDPTVFLYGIAGGLAGVAFAGWLAVRGSRAGPPLKTLRALT